MSYIIQSTRASSLTIDGRDYTNDMIQWQVSDSSANGNGLIQTTGNVILGQRPGAPSLRDYRRDNFRRGQPVILTMIDSSGETYRHPRGLLYVLSTVYYPEEAQLNIEIGCKIALADLLNDPSELLAFTPTPLGPGNQNIQSLANALYAYGEVLYQNNAGQLVKKEFFGGDNSIGVAGGSWVSVLGQTAISVEPLAGTTVIPDRVDVSVDVPVSGELEPAPELPEGESYPTINPSDFPWIGIGNLMPDSPTPGVPQEPQEDEETGEKWTFDHEVSTYYFQYPASVWVRDPEAGTECLLEDAFGNFTEVACIENGDEDGGGTNTTPLTEDPVTSACGNTPEAPQGTYDDGTGEEGEEGEGGEGEEGEVTEEDFKPVPVSCNYGWETKSEPMIVPAIQYRTSRTEYYGPAQQVSRTYEELRGPIVEANSQYFADRHAYCVYLYGYACNPNGSCPFEGMKRALLSYAVTENVYDESDGSLKTTIRDTYRTRLSAAQTFDWRSGQVGGVPQDFNQELIFETGMYRVQRVVTSYVRTGGFVTTTITTTHDSPTSRSVGLYAGDIDALGPNGIRTTSRRTSYSYDSTAKPDSLAVPLEETEVEETEVLLNTEETEDEYVLETTIPTPAPDDEDDREEFILDYTEMIPRWIKGEAYGLQVTEALRREIIERWYPGKPFRFCDPVSSEIIGMRMNASNWAVTTDAAVVTTDGMWTGFSSGTLVVGTNVVGDSTPDMSGAGQPSVTSATTTTKAISDISTKVNVMTPGNYYSVPTLATSGSGEGLTVDIEVINNGQNIDDYTLTISQPGAGYQVGDDILIELATLQQIDPGVPSNNTFRWTIAEVYDDNQVPPYILDDVIGQDYIQKVDVKFYLQANVEDPGADGVIPIPPQTDDERTYKMEQSLTVFVSGAIVEPGAILGTVGAGSMPIGANGNLLTTGTVVVNNNLFGPAA